MDIYILLFILLISFFVAKTEINIEGKNGWAKDLPTWRKTNKLTKLILGNYPLTGYHLWMFLSFFLFFHFPFFTGLNWTLSYELKIIAFFLLFALLEDFFWFILNPHYGINKFNKKHIAWHNDWIFGFPLSYIKLLLGGIICLTLSYFIKV